MTSPEIPYSFTEQGHLPVQRIVLDPSGAQDYQKAEHLDIPATAFAPDPIDPSERLLIRFSQPSGFKDLSYYASSGNEDGKLVGLHTLAWGGTLDNGVSSNEAYRVASALPDHDHVFLSMPGHGQDAHSSRWPMNVRLQMLREGSFRGTGEYLSRFFYGSSDISPGRETKAVDVFGNSTGARSALHISEHLNVPIRNLVLYDPPGSRELGYRGLVRNFMGSESSHGRQYTEESLDVQHVGLMRQAPNRKSFSSIWQFARRDLLAAWDLYGGELRAMGKGTLEADFKRADLSNVGRVVLLSPAFSCLNNLDDISKVLISAQATHPNTTFEHYIFPGTHTAPRMASTFLAELYKLAIHPNARQIKT